MPLYRYIKAKSGKSSYINRAPKKKSKKSRFLFGLISTSLFISGIFIVGQAIFPIVAWYVFSLPLYASGISSPLATNFHPEQSPLFPAMVVASETINPQKAKSYDANSWFAGANNFTSNIAIKTYSLSIPKIGINKAVVKVGDIDLKKSLIAWETSALPGNYGNNIIFGHSELPQFASPTRYDGIFTYIMDLEEGDIIEAVYDGVNYQYKVIYKKVVSPNDLSVLEQRFDNSYITLITCVPPGTLWMRGVVVGQLVKNK